MCCGTGRDVDPAVESAITSPQNNPDIPDSWVEFTWAATDASLITVPDDVQCSGESFSHACLDYAIADDLGRDRTSDDVTRRLLAEQGDVHVTAEQFELVKPALERICEDMKPERRGPTV